MTVFLARFALDAQEAFLATADGVPEQFRDSASAGMNSAAWTITHVAESHQVFVGEYAGARPRDRAFDAFRSDAAAPMAYGAAIDALMRVMAEATSVLGRLDEADLARPASTREGSRFTGWTVEQMLARAIAHLYVHAADLAILISLDGGVDPGLPGWMLNVHPVE